MNHIIALIAGKWLLQYCTGPRSWGWGGGGGGGGDQIASIEVKRGGDISTPASRQSCNLVSRTYKVGTEMPHRGVISVSRLLTTMDTKPLACRAQYGA